MPALYDETWCARVQLERMRLVLNRLDALSSRKNPQVQDMVQVRQKNGQTQVELASNREPLPLNEGSGGQLTLF